MDVAIHQHPVFHSAIAEIVAGVSLLPATPSSPPDGSRAYGIPLSDGDHVRLCIDADGTLAFSLFDRHSRRYVADLTLGRDGVAGQLEGRDVAGGLFCAGVDVAELFSALRDATATGGASRFSFEELRREAA